MSDFNYKSAAIYIRYSSENNFESALERINEFLNFRGYFVEDIFSDRDNDLHQPDLNTFIKSLSSENYGAFCVVDMKHLPSVASRTDDFFEFVASLSNHSIRFFSIAEGLDSNGSAQKFVSQSFERIEDLKPFFKKTAALVGMQKAKESGKHIGRPFSSDYSKVYELRKAGLSYRKISEVLGISKGTVQHALSVERSSKL